MNESQSRNVIAIALEYLSEEYLSQKGVTLKEAARTELDRLQALADLMVKRERVKCGCDNGTVKIRGADNVLLTVKCMGCHGSGYVEQVKPGKLLEALEKLLDTVCNSCQHSKPGDISCKFCMLHAKHAIAEARLLMEKSE